MSESVVERILQMMEGVNPVVDQRRRRPHSLVAREIVVDTNGRSDSVFSDDQVSSVSGTFHTHDEDYNDDNDSELDDYGQQNNNNSNNNNDVGKVSPTYRKKKKKKQRMRNSRRTGTRRRKKLLLLHNRNIAMVGRHEEVAMLREGFQRIKRRGSSSSSSSSSSSGVFWIEGASGVGKTRLVESSLRQYVSSRNGCFVAGKFDQHQEQQQQQQQPTLRNAVGPSYGALGEALTDLCDLLVQLMDDTDQKRLRDQLGVEAKTLTRLIPNLHLLLPELGQRQQQRKAKDEDNEEEVSSFGVIGHLAFQRLAHLCVSFLKGVATSERPIVLFLDDIQWVDEASLRILRSLWNDSDLKNILFVHAFRPQEWVVPKVMIEASTIRVGDLDAYTVRDFIGRLLQSNEEKVGPLSEVVYSKTHGNAYFMLQFLEQLERDEMLILMDDEWIWNMERVQTETNVSENVAELVTRKIEGLPPVLQHVLKLASFLGFCFETSTLRLVVKAEYNATRTPQCSETTVSRDSHPSLSETDHTCDSLSNITESPLDTTGILTDTDMNKLLTIAVHEGLLEKSVNNQKYKFSHDRVQSCLFGIVEEKSERPLLHLRIGRVLRRETEKQHHNSQLLQLATDHLNLGSMHMTNTKEVMQLAEMNVQAGQIALQQYAFSRARDYLQKGLNLLVADSSPTLKWTVHYKTSVELVTALVYAEFCEGTDYSALRPYCEDLLTHARRVEDKLKLYKIMVVGIGAKDGKLPDAIVFGVSVLRELGENMSKKPNLWNMIREISRTKRVLNCKTDSDLLNLETMRDSNKIAAMEMMSTMTYAVHLDEESKAIFGGLALRMMYLTCRYGHSEWSPLAFAQYGAFQSVLGNSMEANRFFRLTVELIKRSTSTAAKTQTILTIHGMVSHWSKPYQVAQAGFLEAYKLGMECGDIDIALFASNQYCYVALHTGMKLDLLESELRSFCQRMKEFNLAAALRLTLPMWQLTQCLLGDVDDPAELTGKIIDHEVFRQELEQGTNVLANHILLFIRLLLALNFNAWDLMCELLPQVYKNRNNALRGHVSIYACVFYEGLAASKLYNRTCLKRFRKRARSCAKLLDSWAKKGVVNCEATALLMKAEKVVMDDDGSVRFEVVTAAYDEAMDKAREMGLLQWEGMISERAFQVALLQFGDRTGAISYLRRAIDVYSSWGAFAKVDSLYGRYASLLDTDKR